MNKKNITMFYGKECPHCHMMLPIVDKLVSEGHDIQKLEVWHNKENEKEMRKFEKVITESCDGELAVPCFLNREKNRAFCGEISYKELKEWISKE